MDETTWKIVQIGMWVIGGQTAILGFGFLFLWNSLSNKIDKLEAKLTAKIDALEARLTARIDALEAKVIDIDKRLYGVETALHMKDCCVLKQDQNLRKAE